MDFIDEDISSTSDAQFSTPGTRVSRKRTHRKTKERNQDQDRKFFLTRLSRMGQQVRSPAIERINIQAQFFHLYMSQDNAKFPGCTFFAENAKYHPFMQSALDTLSLVAIGTSSGERRLINKAQHLYLQTLGHFRKQLDVVPVRHPFVLLQTVHVIQLCEMFHAISQDGYGWQPHMKGLDAIIESASPEGRRECGNLGRDLIEQDNRVSFPLWEGLLLRKDLDTAEELFSTAGHSPDAKMASRLVIDRQVPGILRYTQYVAQQGKTARESDVSDAVGAIVGMEGRLHAAMSVWYSELSSMSYRTCKIESLEGRLLPTGDSANAFPHALTFPNIGFALKHVHYWLCLLALRQVHVEIRKAVKPTAYSLGLYEGTDALLHRTDECADNLCMSIVYMTLSKNGIFGLITAIPPLQMATRWYKQSGNSEKLAWCSQVANRLRACGLAVPSELFSDDGNITNPQHIA